MYSNSGGYTSRKSGIDHCGRPGIGLYRVGIKWRTPLRVLMCLWVLLTAQSVVAVQYRGLDEHGVRLYTCDWFCGNVRVKKIETGIYRVFSIHFSGDMRAASELTAARIACQELPSDRTGVVSPLPSRGTGACP
jgi:hypothetical protein